MDPARRQVAEDKELLEEQRRFQQARDEICRLTEADDGLSQAEFLDAHRRWMNACMRAATLPATTADGLRAKAAMVTDALQVAFDGQLDSMPHVQLALSLARDVLTE